MSFLYLKRYLPIIMIFAFLTSCATGKYIDVNELKSGNLKAGGLYKIRSECNLEGRVLTLPYNSTLEFMGGGSIRNGTITGQNVRLRYHKPFIGESTKIQGCVIDGKRVIRDKDVFITVAHSQEEIQLLFDISGGAKLIFSPGNYQNIERIEIRNNIDADFSNSIITLKSDMSYVAECFYMEPWVNKNLDFFKIKNLTIKGKRSGIKSTVDRRCIQLFYVSEVELDNITIDQFDGGPEVYKDDSSDLLDKTRIGTSAVAIMRYDKCIINNCRTNDINKEIFWCVPNDNPRNITYFTNNKSTCSSMNGSLSFLTLLDGCCIVKGNEVHNYNGSAFNVFCYDSEISFNKFYDGRRSIAIDLSEGTMYRSKKVRIHDNYCFNTREMVSAFGENITINNNRWINDNLHQGNRIYVVKLNTRGKRTPQGHYIGCENNPENGVGSINIVIEGNECVNNGGVKGEDIRFACLYGDDVKVSRNTLIGFNVPVVQLVEGVGFVFKSNVLKESRNGNYAELLVNRCDDIKVNNNSFSLLFTKRDTNSTVQLLNPGGRLVYKRNKIDKLEMNKEYTPCLIEDHSRLLKTEIHIDKNGY